MNVHQILPASATASIPGPFTSDPPQRILLVEDDADLRRFNTEVLMRNGYHVDATEDGALAWEALTARSYDLLITDNQMPNVTGVELLRKIHSANMLLPVVMATGVLPESEFNRNPELVPAATLLKPYTVPELLRAVRAVLHSTGHPAETLGQVRYGQDHPLPNHLPL